MTLDDETLMAFADGELPAPRAAEVEKAVAADPSLAAKVERFRIVKTKLAGSLDGLAPRPDVMTRAQAAVAVHDQRRRLQPWPVAVAAGVAGLAIGATLMAMLGSGDGSAIGSDMRARGVLSAALDGAASGTTRSGVSPLYTVVTADGRRCRVFRMERDGRFEGVACRERNGWQVAVLAELGPKTGGFAQASSSEGVIADAVLDPLKPSDPLTAEAEAALIKRGWTE